MLMLEPPFTFVSGAYRIKRAEDAWERRECARLRRDVFCAEQHLFDTDDSDAIDAHALPIAALRCVASMPDAVVGTVRVHEIEPGLWQGSRLAVAPECRKVAGLGTELIRYAVSFAHARGARRFIAQVQAQNVPLFRRLHWRALGEMELLGRAHCYMEADLAYYPPLARAEIDLVAPAAARVA
jgi:putative N-acetyltransferase (TIGR04045 family)